MDNSQTYGLDEKELLSVISVLKQNAKIDSVILFGSRAKGNFSVGSDVDISLLGANITLNDILEASLKIDELELPYKFDLIIYDRIQEKALIEHINRIGIKLFDRNEK